MKIAIFGFARTGKTTLATALQKSTGLPVYHTDHFSEKYGYKNSIYVLEKELPESYIVEGIMIARMLRKAEQDESFVFAPDILYYCVSDLDTIKRRCKDAGAKFKDWERQAKGLLTIHEEWLAMPDRHKPEIRNQKS